MTDSRSRDLSLLRARDRERLQKNGKAKAQILLYLLQILTSIIKFRLGYDFITKTASKGQGFWLY